MLRWMLILLLPCLAWAQPPLPFPEAAYLQRVWQDARGGVYSVIPSKDGVLRITRFSDGASFRYQMDNGQMIRRPADAPLPVFAEQQIEFDGQLLQPLPHTLEEIWFDSAGVRLYGMLVSPISATPVPAVVVAHGSGKDAATDYYFEPAVYLQAEVATLLFDKRGTGRSGGDYSHDFVQLAADLSAALSVLEDRPEIDAKRLGVVGLSQGVYVALQAAADPRIRFLIAGYGMLESPLAEDLQETRQKFEAAYPNLDWSEFEPFAQACGLAFGARQDAQWKAVKQGRRTWRKRVDAEHLAGTMTGDGCLRYGPMLLKAFGRRQLPPGLDWDFDANARAAALSIPTLFQFGEADTEAPSASSIHKIRDYIAAGKPFTIKTYAGADHGMKVWLNEVDGVRNYRVHPDYIADQISWLRTQLGALGAPLERTAQSR